jgi:hypothetical protein
MKLIHELRTLINLQLLKLSRSILEIIWQCNNLIQDIFTRRGYENQDEKPKKAQIKTVLVYCFSTDRRTESTKYCENITKFMRKVWITALFKI